MVLIINTYIAKKKKRKKENADNHYHNIMRLVDVCLNFPFTTSETKCNY